MVQEVLNIFLKIRESFSEIKEKVSLLKTCFELHVSSPGMAMKLEEFEKLLGFNPPKLAHKDPFDRLIIWQAIQRKMSLISRDRSFKDYKQNGLKMHW